jgi:hypothetical protein
MKMSMRLTAAAGAGTLLASAMFCASASAATYAADPASSRLEFTGVQAGAAFKGVFHQFSAAVDFDPAAPASAHIDVTIDIKSEDTGDKDRDGTMRGADIFDVARFPDGALRDSQRRPDGGTGFSAVARAHAARGHQGRADRVQVRCRPPPARALSGTARAQADSISAWGRGDWKNTDWVADAVKVAFSLAI